MPAPDIQRSEDALPRVPFLGGTVNSDLGRAEAVPPKSLVSAALSAGYLPPSPQASKS